MRIPARWRGACSRPGSAPGDRVGIWAPNCAEWVLLQFATAKIGAILVNINPAYRTRELAYVLRQSGVRLLVSAQSFKTSDYRAMIDEVAAACPRWSRSSTSARPSGTSCSPRARGAGRRRAAARGRQLAFDDPINIQYTSGTTGFPKGATLSHHNILNNGFFIGEMCRYTERDRVCIPVPFYHCFGMVLGNLAAPRTAPASSSRRRASIPPPRWRAVAGREVHVAVRRADHVHRRARPARLRRLRPVHLRTGIMAGSPARSR